MKTAIVFTVAVGLLAISAAAMSQTAKPNASAIFEMARIADEKPVYSQDFESESTVDPIQLWYEAPAAAKGSVVSKGVDKAVGFDGSAASYRVELSFDPGNYGGIYLRFPVSIPVWSDMKLQWRIKAESEPKISLGYRHGLSSGVAGGTDGNCTYGVKVKDADKDGWELWQASIVSSKTNPAEYISGISLYVETSEIPAPTKAVFHIDDIRIVGRLQSGWETEWKNVWTYYTVYAEKEQRESAQRRLVTLRSWSEALAKREAALQSPEDASPMLQEQFEGAAGKMTAALAEARPLVEAVEDGLEASGRFSANVHAAELKLMDASYWMDVGESCIPYAKVQKNSDVITYTLDPTQSYEILPSGPTAHIDEQAYNGWDEVAGYYQSPAVLPNLKPVPAKASSSLVGQGARGTYVPFSFAIETQEKLEDLTFTVGTLSSGKNKLNAKADIRVVAPVYMPVGSGKEPQLRNVMLVHDSDFVRTVGKAEGYNRFKDAKKPVDAAAMQPITIEADQARQFYLLVKVPADAKPGIYQGLVSGKAADGTKMSFALKLEVLPFKLEPTPNAYSAFNESFIADAATVEQLGVGFEKKTFEQINQDFLSQAEHGFNTLHLKNGYVPRSKGDRRDRSPLEAGNSWNFADFDQMLDAAVKAGLSRSPFCWESSHGVNLATDPRPFYANTTEQMVASINAIVPALVAHCKQKGYPSPALFGADEFTGERLMGMKPGYEAVKKAGGLVTIACYSDFFGILGPDLVQPILLGGVTDSETERIVRTVQSKGLQVWIYNCPASNVYGAPSSIRRRYGLAMWRNGENGVANWAYDNISVGYANLATSERPVYCYAFPTWSGRPIDTLTYEALREGIYDTRYMATLEKALAVARKSGKSPALVGEVDNWLKSFSVNDDLGKVRRRMADYIVRLQKARG